MFQRDHDGNIVKAGGQEPAATSQIALHVPMNMLDNIRTMSHVKSKHELACFKAIFPEHVHEVFFICSKRRDNVLPPGRFLGMDHDIVRDLNRHRMHFPKAKRVDGMIELMVRPYVQIGFQTICRNPNTMLGSKGSEESIVDLSMSQVLRYL